MQAWQQGQNMGEIPVAEGVRLTDLVNYQEGSVVQPEAIVKRATGTVTLFAFDDGQGIKRSEHTAAFTTPWHICSKGRSGKLRSLASHCT